MILERLAAGPSRFLASPAMSPSPFCRAERELAITNFNHLLTFRS